MIYGKYNKLTENNTFRIIKKYRTLKFDTIYDGQSCLDDTILIINYVKLYNINTLCVNLE